MLWIRALAGDALDRHARIAQPHLAAFEARCARLAARGARLAQRIGADRRGHDRREVHRTGGRALDDRFADRFRFEARFATTSNLTMRDMKPALPVALGDQSANLRSFIRTNKS